MGIPLSSVANSRPTRPLIPFFNNRIFQKGCAKMLKGYISLILLAAIAISLTSSSIVKRQIKPIDPIDPIRPIDPTTPITSVTPITEVDQKECANACARCADFGDSGLNFNCAQSCGFCPLCRLFYVKPGCDYCTEGTDVCKVNCIKGKEICRRCGC